MTNDFNWAELERELRAHLPSDFSRVLVGEHEDENGIRHVFLLPKRLLTQDEVLAACREIAPIIRDRISERPDHWSAAIGVQRISGEVMALYYLGWANHPDESKFFGLQTTHADWMALVQRLRKALTARGMESPEGEGDFSLGDEDDGRPRVRLAIYRIEFLTPELVADIQAVLEDGFAGWCVGVSLYLDFSERIGPEGIVIWADEIIENWDRARLKRRLGDRLKL
jgi:hypothetical protein